MEAHINTNSVEIHYDYKFIFSTNVTDEQIKKRKTERSRSSHRIFS